MQQGELLKRTPVERQIADLLFGDEPAQRRGGRVDSRRPAFDSNGVFNPTDCQCRIDHRVLAHGQRDASPQHRLKA
ncbi:MAG TPA: hypothetical protein VI479_08990, partial [Blastocatellia bacterium]